MFPSEVEISNNKGPFPYYIVHPSLEQNLLEDTDQILFIA